MRKTDRSVLSTIYLFFRTSQHLRKSTRDIVSPAAHAGVNTSFNVRGEPIVCSPQDAYRFFMRTEMDFLAVEGFLLDKSKQPEWTEEKPQIPLQGVDEVRCTHEPDYVTYPPRHRVLRRPNADRPHHEAPGKRLACQRFLRHRKLSGSEPALPSI